MLLRSGEISHRSSGKFNQFEPDEKEFLESFRNQKERLERLGTIG